MFGEIIFFLLLRNMKTYFFKVEMSTEMPMNLSVFLLLGNVWDWEKVKLARWGARQFSKGYISACVFLSPGKGMSRRTLVCSPSRMFITSYQGDRSPVRLQDVGDLRYFPSPSVWILMCVVTLRLHVLSAKHTTAPCRKSLFFHFLSQECSCVFC